MGRKMYRQNAGIQLINFNEARGQFEACVPSDLESIGKNVCANTFKSPFSSFARDLRLQSRLYRGEGGKMAVSILKLNTKFGWGQRN